jgi:hypothetical protein
MNNSITTSEEPAGNLLKFPVTKAKRMPKLKSGKRGKMDWHPTTTTRYKPPMMCLIAANNLVKDVLDFCSWDENLVGNYLEDYSPYLDRLEASINECRSMLLMQYQSKLNSQRK